MIIEQNDLKQLKKMRYCALLKKFAKNKPHNNVFFKNNVLSLYQITK